MRRRRLFVDPPPCTRARSVVIGKLAMAEHLTQFHQEEKVAPASPTSVQFGSNRSASLPPSTPPAGVRLRGRGRRAAAATARRTKTAATLKAKMFAGGANWASSWRQRQAGDQPERHPDVRRGLAPGCSRRRPRPIWNVVPGLTEAGNQTIADQAVAVIVGEEASASPRSACGATVRDCGFEGERIGGDPRGPDTAIARCRGRSDPPSSSDDDPHQGRVARRCRGGPSRAKLLIWRVSAQSVSEAVLLATDLIFVPRLGFL